MPFVIKPDEKKKGFAVCVRGGGGGKQIVFCDVTGCSFLRRYGTTFLKKLLFET